MTHTIESLLKLAEYSAVEWDKKTARAVFGASLRQFAARQYNRGVERAYTAYRKSVEIECPSARRVSAAILALKKPTP
jgi:hypothetical protein